MNTLALLSFCIYIVAALVSAQDDFDDLLTLVPYGDPKRCTKYCGTGYSCEVQQCRCEACIKDAPTCATTECLPNEKCEDTPAGPVCKLKTCEDIYCAAGLLCNELPDGPDCVPDVPSCAGFYCRRGTNCFVRSGHPICLPNTCAVRECEHGLTCVDTIDGALCRRGAKTRGCEGRYCPENTVCTDEDPTDPHCIHI